MAYYEVHQNLRGGNGMIITQTVQIMRVRFIKLDLDPEASIGEHLHDVDSELYISFDRNIRFSGNKEYKLFNFCRKGSNHSAENVSKERMARIWAIKF